MSVAHKQTREEKIVAVEITEMQVGIIRLKKQPLPAALVDALNAADDALQTAYMLAEYGTDD